jgi:glycogenin
MKAGGCLAPSLPNLGPQSSTLTECAYATMLTSDDHLRGVLLLNQSLKMVGAAHKLVTLATDGVSESALRTLSMFDIETRVYPTIAMPEQARIKNAATGFTHYNTHLSKLYIFDLNDFAKIVYMDADMLLLRNIDHLFLCDHLTAVADAKSAPGWNHFVGLNSGLMVIEPNVGLLAQLLETVPQVVDREPTVGDQAIINYFYGDWPTMAHLHLDVGYNLYEPLIHHYVRNEGYRAFGEDKRIVAVHFIGARKPWMRTPYQWAKHLLGLALRGKVTELRVNAAYCALLVKVALRQWTTAPRGTRG